MSLEVRIPLGLALKYEFALLDIPWAVGMLPGSILGVLNPIQQGASLLPEGEESLVSFKILYEQDEIPPADVTIKAVGYQWYWGYEYPDENIIFDSYMIEEKDLKPGQPRLLSVDNEIVVPVNKVVKVLITANDVLHAWALPSFGVKRDAVPGRINETWFKADRTGTFYGQCSELCGIKHAFMPITVNVVSQEDYDKWLKDAKQKFAKEELDLNKKVVKRILEEEIK